MELLTNNIESLHNDISNLENDIELLLVKKQEIKDDNDKNVSKILSMQDREKNHKKREKIC